MQTQPLSRNAQQFVRQVAAMRPSERAAVRAKFQRVLDDPDYQEKVRVQSALLGQTLEQALQQARSILAVIDALS